MAYNRRRLQKLVLSEKGSGMEMIMTYNQYIKNLAKSPLVLTANILLSVLVFFQFIFLFIGRWIDIVEFGANVLLLVTTWMMFAKARSNREKSMSSVRTCTFVFAIVRLISLCIALIGIFVAAIYVMGNATPEGAMIGSGNEIAGGLILLLFGGGIYIVRIIISVFFLSETGKIRRQSTNYILKRNWKVWFIVCAALRGGSLLVQWIFTVMTLTRLHMLAFGSYYFEYGTNSSLASIISAASASGGIVGVILGDLLYIAFFIILAVIMGRYFKAVKKQ